MEDVCRNIGPKNMAYIPVTGLRLKAEDLWLEYRPCFEDLYSVSRPTFHLLYSI